METRDMVVDLNDEEYDKGFADGYDDKQPDEKMFEDSQSYRVGYADGSWEC